MTNIHPASAKQINWIADLLATRDWANATRQSAWGSKGVSRAATLNLMITWAKGLLETGEVGVYIVPDGIREAMTSDHIGERVNQGLAYVLEQGGAAEGYYEFCYKPFTSKDASALIDWLKPMGPKATTVVVTKKDQELADERGISPLTTATDSGELEDGMYRNNAGDYLKVYKTQKGHQVAKIAKITQKLEFSHVDNGEDIYVPVEGEFIVEFEYVGKRPLKTLRPSMKLTIEQAREFGMIYGSCVCCNRTLTDELSVYLGIGPVCGNREFGEPFKRMVKQAKSDIALKEANSN